MRQTTIWTAAAGATLGFAADAAAAPATFDIAWTSEVGSTGTGFFTIDDSLLVPGLDDANDIIDVAQVDAFGATFTNVPGFGTLSFDLGDLASVDIKIDDAGQNVTAAGFGTTRVQDAPYMSQIAAFQSVKLADADSFLDDTELATYEGVVTLRTAAIPEPGTLALLAAGAAALPLLRRRRTQGKST
jgi:hypothetical protein